jgi:hypothetical protein
MFEDNSPPFAVNPALAADQGSGAKEEIAVPGGLMPSRT